MPKSGPIILVEDDPDDQRLFAEILSLLNMKNKVHWFTNGPEALTFLKGSSEQPFIIFCDMNLPKETGIQFKKKIDADPLLRKKSIPFLFYSTSVDRTSVMEAYMQLTVQGYFEKPTTLDETKRILQLIFSYWEVCKHPNS